MINIISQYLSEMKIGAHVSIAGGYSTALKQAKTIRANTVQIFAASPRSWLSPQPNPADIKKFLQTAKRQKISPIFVHAKYLINLDSQNQTTSQRSVKSLTEDLQIAAKIMAAGVIFHPHLGHNQRLKKNILTVLHQSPPNTKLILENAATTDLGKLIDLLHDLNHPRLGLCLDTAHLFQSGLAINTPTGMEKMFNLVKKIGWKKVAVIHTNDSRTAPGSRHDVHEDIGQGQLTNLPFITLTNHPQTKNLPFILETPAGKTDLNRQRQNLDRIRKLGGQRLDRSFFSQKTITVAKKLLGKLLIFEQNQQTKMGLISETEAYLGPQDLACHSAKGRTSRTEPMFGPPGNSYVYLIYGKYFCLNLVTEKTGFPAAVLIRSLKPVFGIAKSTDGPGKICRELGLTKKQNNLETTKSNRLYLKDIGLIPEKIAASPRVGVDYAGLWAKKKLRFEGKF